MDRVYTCEEVAEMYRVKISTVWGWVRDGKLKAIKIGKSYRIKQEHLDEFEKTDAEHSC